MPPRKRGGRKPQKPDLPPTGVLDWTYGHWGGVDFPCRYCKALTPLRDSKGHAAHKVCAEAALAAQVEEYAASYENERFLK
ncbi:hypothetical protein [Streptomyces sp. NPDC047070]|uniref:hypothetical protein n=1 Tax=Streptomyces sp. NPDC047070 TaxID=3154923 RepID=UPI00345286A4